MSFEGAPSDWSSDHSPQQFHEGKGKVEGEGIGLVPCAFGAFFSVILSLEVIVS